MKKILISLITLTVIACSQVDDSDGVPKVTDINNIVIDGQKMTAYNFYKKYCQLKSSNDTCNAMASASMLEDSKSETPAF